MNDIELATKFIRKHQSSISRNIVFDLSFTSFKNLMRAKKCYYTGVTLTTATGPSQKETDRTIDRIDPSKGYVKGNVVACCYKANQIKSTLEHNPKIASSIIKKSKIFS